MNGYDRRPTGGTGRERQRTGAAVRSAGRPGAHSFAAQFTGGRTEERPERDAYQHPASPTTYHGQFVKSGNAAEPAGYQDRVSGRVASPGYYYPNGGQGARQGGQGAGLGYDFRPPYTDNRSAGSPFTQSAWPSGGQPVQGPPPRPMPQANGFAQAARWQFLDLGNRKQTGDLYKKILSYNKKDQAKVFCFTSSTRGEGVTTIVANLMHYIRNQGRSKAVVVIDCNMDAPELHRTFGLRHPHPGLIDVISRQADLSGALQPIGQNMFVLDSGGAQGAKRPNMEPDDFIKVVQACRQFADYTIIDCPPVLNSSDVFSVAPAADVSFLVVQAVKARRQVVEKSVAALRNHECEIGGVVFNRVQQVIPGWVYKYL